MSAVRRPGVLYDLVALGMTGYTDAKYDAAFVGADRLRLEPGMLLVSTHRSDDDVPLLCARLYWAERVWRRTATHLSFAVRDDLFAPGFFAGYPPGLPTLARRLLWPLDVGPVLRSRLACLPIRSATSMNLADALREAPGLRLGSLPPPLRDALRARARELGLPEPALAADVLRGEYGPVLWRQVTRTELGVPELEQVWARRAVEAAGDFRRLVEVLRAPGALLLFPEGAPSPDGRIGPLRPGLERLARRGRPRGLQPIALAYDPLVAGRPRAVVAAGEPIEAPAGERVEEETLRALRRTTPLVAGHVVASLSERLGRAPTLREGLDGAERALDAARRERRPVDPRLEGPGLQPAVEVALARMRALGPGHAAVRRLALTHESAAELAA